MLTYILHTIKLVMKQNKNRRRRPTKVAIQQSDELSTSPYKRETRKEKIVIHHICVVVELVSQIEMREEVGAS